MRRSIFSGQGSVGFAMATTKASTIASLDPGPEDHQPEPIISTDAQEEPIVGRNATDVSIPVSQPQPRRRRKAKKSGRGHRRRKTKRQVFTKLNGLMIDEATIVDHVTSRFAKNETVMHDSYCDDATRNSRRIRQVAGHVNIDWQFFRTLLANERNIMAWMRTFLKFMGLTWTVLSLPQFRARTLLDSPIDQALGLLCVLVAVTTMLLGIRRYVRWNNTLDFPNSHIRGAKNIGWQLYAALAFFVVLAAILVFRNIMDSGLVDHNHNISRVPATAPAPTPELELDVDLEPEPEPEPEPQSP